MNNCPLIIVTCLRDIKMLELQAQSLSIHYTDPADVYLIVNEADPTIWFEQFNNFKHYYDKFNLKIMVRNDFDINCDNMHGWDDQQLLKLAISQHITQDYYFVLDTQNFLINPWSTANLPMDNGRVPYRNGNFALPLSTWHEYCLRLEINVSDPTSETMSFCTPLFFKTALVKSLIDSHKSLNRFSWWFRNASRIKSEFILYYLWAEKNGGFMSHHYKVDCWANPYLRDSDTFSKDFRDFMNTAGNDVKRAWISINHRSWGDLSLSEYNELCRMLRDKQLTPDFEDFRATYIDERR